MFRETRICLAGSGGGHVRQLLDLQPLWQEADSFFVTEDTALGRSIATDRPTRFVAHVALGQARLGAPIAMLFAAIRNLFQSLGIIWTMRPDIILTTGAGSMFFTVLWGRLFGAKIVLIDSFARFDGPSVFARIAGPISHIQIAQSEAAAAKWGKAVAFDPFRMLDGPRPAKRPLLFATVGATLPFPRLVELVADARRNGVFDEELILQRGTGAPAPQGVESVETLDFGTVQTILSEADIVVTHGGTGSLITALRAGCRVVAIPRRFARGEHYDDHQGEITAAFARRGLISIADTPEDFVAALAECRAREPKRATTDYSAMIDYLRGMIGKWTASRRGK